MKPILFNTEMVRAILAGWKTMTRRVIKPQPDAYAFLGVEDGNANFMVGKSGDGYCADFMVERKLPYQIGDILYVRETWQRLDSKIALDLETGEYAYVYKASDNGKAWEENTENWKWRPSIHMPKEAARIFLRVTNVRAERLHDITEERAIAEGAKGRQDFIRIWNSTVKKLEIDKYGWDANPWVWVIEFEMCERSVEHDE
jgi:hypothetical protein